MSKSLLPVATPIACCVAAAFASPSFAQTTPVVQAQDVMVTASRSEKALADVNMAVSVITSEDIKRAGSVKGVADLLETHVPGLRVRNDGSQGMDRISIRGEDAFRTLVMINGQRITEQKSMSGAPILIDPSQVERIEVIRGPASVLYGSDAIGGAVNIITKKGGDKFIGGSISAGYDGSADANSVSGSLSGSSNGWNWRVGAATKDYDLLETPIGKAPHTQFKSKAADAFLSYDIDADKTVGMTLSHYDLDFWSGDQSQASADDFWVHVPEWKRTRGALFGEFKNISDTLSRVRVDLSQERNAKTMDNHVVLADAGKMSGANINSFTDNTTDTTALSIQTDWNVADNHFVIAGYEMAYDKLEADSNSRLKHVMQMGPIIIPIDVSAGDATYDGHQTRHAIFATVESTLTDDLIANYGVRYTWVKSEMDIDSKAHYEYDGTRPVEKPAEQKSLDNSKGRAVFNAGLTYKGFDDLTLRANYAQGYRTPILQELFIDSNMGGRITIANPNLKPETSDNFEIGARYQNNGLTIDGTVFYTEADNYITAIKHEAEGRKESQYANVAHAKTLGLELESSWKVGDFEPYAVVTLMSREFEHNGFSTKKTGTPKVAARYGIRYTTSAMKADWNADLYAITQSKSEELIVEDKNTTTLSSYSGFTTFNLTGGVSFGPNKAYRLDAGVYNIGDKLYRYNGGKMDQFDRSVYEPGRHAAVKFTATF